MQCFIWLLLLAGAVFVMMTLLRWFEQVAEAVDNGWWNKLLLLVCMPFVVWLFPGGRVGAGRPTPVAPHQPVRGFGTVPKPRLSPSEPPRDIPVANLATTSPPTDGPPPGTPKEFMGMPVIPPKNKPRAALDPEKVAQLRQKMREQGMLGPDD